ncbi:hypothetical protein [Bacillus luti]|uniref:Uncharacterized protein n=1 Tax=Bacillus luti TaxID=2026191 RepID=A0A7V7V4R6_9BACI|nr:hypothetical protein [Bacillus luti]KAB2442728.1 hypothetical protein F8163_13425 [Bacillus luti]
MNLKNLKKKTVPMLLVGGLLAGTGAFTANSAYAAETNKEQSSPSHQAVKKVENFKPSQEALAILLT